MRCVICVCLGLLAFTPTYVQSAPVPKQTTLRAIIDAHTEKNIQGALESIAWGARVGVRENAKVANLDLIRRQKDWEAWLKKNLRVERAPGTNLIYVRFQDGNREEQAAIINVVVDYYLTTDVQSRKKSVRESIQVCKSMYERLHRDGRITAEECAKKVEGLKKLEEYIRTLPELVEHAKAR